jgi:hypothetical protein
MNIIQVYIRTSASALCKLLVKAWAQIIAQRESTLNREHRRCNQLFKELATSGISFEAARQSFLKIKRNGGCNVFATMDK